MATRSSPPSPLHGRGPSLRRWIVTRTGEVPRFRDSAPGVSDYNEWKGERAPKLRRPTVPRTTGGRAAFREDSLRSGEASAPVAGRPAHRHVPGDSPSDLPALDTSQGQSLGPGPLGHVRCQTRDRSYGAQASPPVSQPTRQYGEMRSATRSRNARPPASNLPATTPS